MNAEKRPKSLRISYFFNAYDSRLCLMFVIVFSVSALLLCLGNLSTDLMASSQNIPGVVTSVFINKDFGDFSGNLFVAFVVLSFYSLSSTISGKRNDNLFIVAMWVSAILANLAFVLMSPAYLTIHAGSSGLTYVWVLPTTYGSSGLVSAFLSGVIILAYKSAWAEPVLRFKQFVIGIGLFALFIVLNLNVSPSTNIAVHLMSFLIMVFFVLSKRFWTWLFS